jgi:hypothetical protein
MQVDPLLETLSASEQLALFCGLRGLKHEVIAREVQELQVRGLQQGCSEGFGWLPDSPGMTPEKPPGIPLS